MDNLIDFLIKHSDEKTADFNRKLVTTKYKIYGVKTRILEQFVKTIIKENIPLDISKPNSYEEILILGMYIAKSKETNQKKLEMLTDLLQYIDNWATCDMIACRLKNFEQNEIYFKNLLQSKNTFYIRFGIVWLMRFRLKTDIENTLNLVLSINSDEYYINMAIAWCLAEAVVVDFDIGYEKIKTIENKFLRNKSIQKACDSFRVNDEEKNKLKLLKI